MDIADAHRIETAFYTHLSPDAHELLQGRVVKEDSQDFKLLHTPNATAWANKVASFGNDGHVASVDAWPRLARGLGGGHFGAPAEVNAVVKEVLNTQYRAGMSENAYAGWNALNDIYNPPADATLARNLSSLPVKLQLDALTATVIAGTYPAEGYASALNAGNNAIKKHPDYMADKNIVPVSITPLTQPTAKELEVAEVSRLVKARISPDGKDALGVSTVPDAQGKSHHWSLAENGSVQRIEIERSQTTNRVTVTDYPKDTRTPNQIHQTTVDLQGNIIEDRIAKLDAQGQWQTKTSEGKLLTDNPSMPANQRPTDKQQPVQHISQLEVPLESKQTIIAPTNYGQLGAASASALKIALDIPEKYRENLQQIVDAMIAKHNLAVDINERSHSPAHALA